MAEAWQSAWVEVLPDFKDFKKKADKQMSDILGGAGTAGGNAAGKNAQPGIIAGLKGMAGPVVAAVAALGIGKLVGDAIGAGIQYGMEGLNLASDLEQSTGAVLAVFKDQAAVIEGFGKNAAKDVGLARTAYQTFAVVVGAQLKNLGIPVERISGQTHDLIKLGADLAAQFGGPTSDAVSALSSLLRGERDPIERYGVGIKQADINARLAAQGLSKLEGEARKQAEIQATLAILWEQTADAQGTFGEESDTLANKQQILQATLQDTQTKLGEALIPAFSALAGFANETLAPALDKLIAKVGPVLGQALEDAAPLIADMAEELAPLVEDMIIAGTEAIPGFVSGLKDMAEGLPEAIQFMSDLAKAGDEVASFLNDISGIGKSTGFENSPFNQFMKATFGSIITPEATKFKGDMNRYMADVGTEGGKGLFQGLSGTTPNVKAQFAAMTSGAAVESGLGLHEAMRVAGLSAGDGLIAGIKFKTPEAAAAAAGMGRRAVEAFRQEMKIQSPSKVMAELGAYMGEGLVVGLDGSGSKVDSAMRSLVSVPSISAGVASSVGFGGTGGMRDGRLAEVLNIYESVSPTATAMEVARRQNALGAV